MQVYITAVDVGYGFTKPFNRLPFPSVVENTTISRFNTAQDNIEIGNPMLISVDGQNYALGSTALAMSSNPNAILENHKRWDSPEYKALMLAGIAQQLPPGTIEADVYLVTGLPYLQSKDKNEVNGLQKQFTGDFKIIHYENGRPVAKYIRIKRVDVLSQPRGAYYALVGLTERRIKNQLALVSDLGFQSLDYLLLDNGQESDDSNGEDSVAGMGRIYTNLMRELRSAGAPPLRIHEIDRWIDQGFLQKYSAEIHEAFDNGAKAIVKDMKDKLGAVWKRLELAGYVYFVGGSATRLKPYLEKYMGGMRVVFAQNSQQLIVAGYHAFGRAMAKKMGWGELS